MTGNRASLIGRAIRLTTWVAQQSQPFTWAEIADAGELNRRNAYRWLDALEAYGLIYRDGRDRRENGAPVTTYRRVRP